ncbi:MAG: lipoyl synthase [Desulfobacter sp.]|nr:lipoyl synthase [Desulfobacter sp.]WDP88137.1 MAG: lipoyl synthase [Desulfobacter sp.]
MVPKCCSTASKGKPAWLKKHLPRGGQYQRVTRLLSKAKLHTVCQEANCPNMFECFSKDTATFMILGSQCTRHCRFCNITALPPQPVDPEEPQRLAQTVLDLNLRYVVVTSVTRDDLADGGASHFERVIRAVKDAGHEKTQQTGADNTIQVEVLIPDFQGDESALETVVRAQPDVINHNIETVASLYSRVRPEAQYQRSLDLIRQVKALDPDMPTKSGLMVGLGETVDELEQTMTDLFNHNCDILTIGQYLQPTKEHLPVEAYYSPEEFDRLKAMANSIGFNRVASGPFVRSSYQAKELFDAKAL